MSNNNIQILEQGNAAIVEGNTEEFLSLCSDDTEWTFVGERILKRKKAVRQYIAMTSNEPPELRLLT